MAPALSDRPELAPFAHVSFNIDQGCALTEAGGDVVCFSRRIFEPHSGAPTTGGFEAIAYGSHACAADRAGNLTCWGPDDDGESTPPVGAFDSISVSL